MRSIVAGIGGAGGAVATVAFFLPWLSVSCDDMPLAEISAYDRASGIQVTEYRSITTTDDELVEPKPSYWAFLALPIALLALTGAQSMPNVEKRRLLGAATAAVGLMGIALLTTFWLEQRFGLIPPETVTPQLELIIETHIGGWLSLAGHGLGLLSGTLSVILGPHLAAA